MNHPFITREMCMKYLRIALLAMTFARLGAMEPGALTPEYLEEEIVIHDPFSLRGALMMTACSCSLVTVFLYWDMFLDEENS